MHMNSLTVPATLESLEAIAAFVLVEKLVPRVRAVSWSAGAVFLGWGGWMLLRAL